jgi:hypothetical protein
MKLLAPALVFLVVGHLNAATVLTVNWAAATDNGLCLLDGTPLAVGNEIRLGAFDFANTADGGLESSIQPFLTSGNLVGLASHFTIFDTAHIGTDAFAGNLGTVPLAARVGLFEKSSGGVSLLSTSVLFGKQMFLWAFKTTGDVSPAGNFANVLQTGIFSSGIPSNSNSAWFFPNDTGNPESRPIEITNISNATNNALATNPPARVIAGGFRTTTTSLATGNSNAFSLATVAPEPTTATLMMVGFVSLASRRRRQAK